LRTEHSIGNSLIEGLAGAKFEREKIDRQRNNKRTNSVSTPLGTRIAISFWRDGTGRGPGSEIRIAGWGSWDVRAVTVDL